MYGKFKGLIFREDILLAILVVFVGLVSFYLGRVSVGELSLDHVSATQRGIVGEASNLVPKEKSSSVNAVSTQKMSSDEENAKGGYVASKSGTKYHLPWCGSAKQIKEENKVWFKTKEEAEVAGYTPAANCKGI